MASSSRARDGGGSAHAVDRPRADRVPGGAHQYASPDHIVPNFRGTMAMLPDSGWGVVVLTNASSSLPLPLAPTSHRIADAVPASLAGVPLGESGSRFRLMHWVLLAVTALILLSQPRGLWRLTQRRTPTPPRGVFVRDVLLESAWWLALTLLLSAANVAYGVAHDIKGRYIRRD